MGAKDPGDWTLSQMVMARVLDIWVAFVIAYMQTCEIPIRLIPMKHDQVVHNTKKFLWAVIFFLWLWNHGQM
jgi:hypothetical protein